MGCSIRKLENESELLRDIDILLVVKKAITGGLCHFFNRYVKLNNKYMKKFDENKDSLHVIYFDKNNLHGKAVLEKLRLNVFE